MSTVDRAPNNNRPTRVDQRIARIRRFDDALAKAMIGALVASALLVAFVLVFA